MKVSLLNLIPVESWPPALKLVLGRRYEVFLDWATSTYDYGHWEYDAAVEEVQEALQPYSLHGWHCTRLTEFEIAEIVKNGMGLPNAEQLRNRVAKLVESNVINNEIASLLLARNQSSDSNRAGMVWFCFFEPRISGESGINRFFRHWGGEALYNSHESDDVTSPSLAKIGIPCVVEADVPISLIHLHGGLAFKVIRRYLICRGFNTIEPTDHEDRIKKPLPAQFVRAIHRFPDQEFLRLTGCADWDEPISL